MTDDHALKPTHPDVEALVLLLADSLTVSEAARQLEKPRITVHDLAHKPEVQQAVEAEVTERRALAVREKYRHVRRVYQRAADAASGEWAPDDNQLRLMAYFLDWQQSQEQAVSRRLTVEVTEITGPGQVVSDGHG